MNEFAFADATTPMLPRHNHSTRLIAVVIHLAFLGALIHLQTKPAHVSSAGSPHVRIAAYIPGAIGVTPVAAPKPPAPKKTALKTEAAENTPKDDQPVAEAAGSAGVVGAAHAGSAPVHLGSGGSITLVRKVQPVYPPLMQSARVHGLVVLDASIHADGTIGDITVLRSTNEVFTRSAIDAVRQWKYKPIGFEAVVTVTINFTLT